MSTGITQLEAVLRRDRTVTGVVMVVLVAWAYLVYLVWKMGTMDEMGGMGMPPDMVMPQMQRRPSLFQFATLVGAIAVSARAPALTSGVTQT